MTADEELRRAIGDAELLAAKVAGVQDEVDKLSRRFGVLTTDALRLGMAVERITLRIGELRAEGAGQ